MKEHAPKCKSHQTILVGGGNVVHMDCDCDGYHTFTELYDHRITLYIALCKHMHDLYALENPGKYKIWRSKRHSDGELCFGTGSQYVLGIGTKPGEQITYHIPIKRWDETDFVDHYTEAPSPYDGHTSDDVIERLKNL